MNNEKAGANFAAPRSKTEFYNYYRLCDCLAQETITKLYKIPTSCLLLNAIINENLFSLTLT